MKNTILIILLIIASVNLSIAGGPWPQQKGKGYFKLSESWIVFDQYFTNTGLLEPNVKTSIFNTNFYGEYGITDKLSGIVNGPLFTRNFIDDKISPTTGNVIVPCEAINALGDIDLGLKYGVKVSGMEIPVAATLILGLPTGNASAGAQGNLQTGDGEFNQMIQIDAGAGFNLTPKINSYFSTFIGFNNRTNGYSEEFRYGLESGLGFMDRKLWVVARIVGVESLKNGDAVETGKSTSIYSNNTEYTSFSFEAAYYIAKRIGFSASYAGAFRGENIAAAPTYSIGAFYDLSR